MVPATGCCMSATTDAVDTGTKVSFHAIHQLNRNN